MAKRVDAKEVCVDSIRTAPVILTSLIILHV